MRKHSRSWMERCNMLTMSSSDIEQIVEGPSMWSAFIHEFFLFWCISDNKKNYVNEHATVNHSLSICHCPSWNMLAVFHLAVEYHNSEENIRWQSSKHGACTHQWKCPVRDYDWTHVVLHNLNNVFSGDDKSECEGKSKLSKPWPRY